MTDLLYWLGIATVACPIVTTAISPAISDDERNTTATTPTSVTSAMR